MAHEQQEYAPQYSLQKRIRYAIVGAVCLTIWFALCHWWAFPQWREFAETAHCRTVLGISGISVILYVTFVGLPLVVAILLGAIIGPPALRSIRTRQYPPPGMKRLAKVRIRTGRKAIMSAVGELASIAVFLAIALWGGLHARQILKHASLRSGATCSAMHSEAPKAIASLDGEALRKGTLSAGDTR